MDEAWLDFLGAHDLCGLCGNSGIIDTRGDVESAAGVACGVRRFCICPNGRVMKEKRAAIDLWEAGRDRVRARAEES